MRKPSSYAFTPLFPLIPSSFFNKLSCNFLLPAQFSIIRRILRHATTVNPTVLSECFRSRIVTSGVMPISSSK